MAKAGAQDQVAEDPPGILIPGIERFKKTTRVDSLVLPNETSKRMMAAWMIYPHEWSAPEGKAPGPLDKGYSLWAWSWVNVDMTLLAQLAMVSDWDAWKCWDMLMAARLVFPDGTIHSYARRLITKDVRHSLGL